MKVIPVDCNYVGPEFAASYLLVKTNQGKRRGFFIECNTNHAIPYLLRAAQAEGLNPEDIEGLIVTHIHLDHAGGAGLFLKTFPRAKVYAHPRAIKHLIDPSKLIASATQVYGLEFLHKMYGEIQSCSAERVVTLQDGEPFSWSGTEFQIKHTRGHANHHLCVVIPEAHTVFTGDSFGVSYPVVNRKRGLVMMVSTSPTDFDADAAIKTVEWIEGLNTPDHKTRAALTHFGLIESEQISKAAQFLKDQIRFSHDLVLKTQREKLSESQIQEHVHDWTIQYFTQHGITLDPEDIRILSFDMRINAQGLHYIAFKPPKPTESHHH